MAADTFGLLRKVTEGVVYSNNQESFVNWDNNFGTKWTAEEYTNTQGNFKINLKIF